MAKRKRPPAWVNEALWSDATDPDQLAAMLGEMLRFGFTSVSPRKCLLFEVARAFRTLHLFPDDIGRRATELASRAVEEPECCQSHEYTELLAEAKRDASAAVFGNDPSVSRWVEGCYAAALLELARVPEAFEELGQRPTDVIAEAGISIEQDEIHAQSALLRDIFGNPFRPATFSPEWRTDTTTAIARQMYESRDFSAMPILADALQDAGCNNTDILNHCRDVNQIHIRGCWVVDLVLGKQ